MLEIKSERIEVAVLKPGIDKESFKPSSFLSDRSSEKVFFERRRKVCVNSLSKLLVELMTQLKDSQLYRQVDSMSSHQP